MSYVEPVVANTLNAVLGAFMSFGLLMTPQQFMKGGRYQSPWFSNLPEARQDRLYYIAQFMGFLMLGSIVVPTLMYPNSQFLCYQMALIHGTGLLHTLLFWVTTTYEGAHPTASAGIAQWSAMTLLTVGFFVVTVLACVEETAAAVDVAETHISKSTANIIMLAFSSIFGVSFVLFPRFLLSAFWTDEEPNSPTHSIFGFKQLNMSSIEAWWARCVGLAILSLNLGMAIARNIDTPVYTAASLITVTCLSLHNLHQVTMRPYESISSYQVNVSWIPNICMSFGMAAILASAMIYI